MTKHGFTLRPMNEFAYKEATFRFYEKISSARRALAQTRTWFGEIYEIWSCTLDKEPDSACSYLRYVERAE